MPLVSILYIIIIEESAFWHGQARISGSLDKDRKNHYPTAYLSNREKFQFIRIVTFVLLV